MSLAVPRCAVHYTSTGGSLEALPPSDHQSGRSLVFRGQREPTHYEARTIACQLPLTNPERQEGPVRPE